MNAPENNSAPLLAGSWETTLVAGIATPLEEHYPNQKPSLTFDLPTQRVSGNTGCNQFNGPLILDGWQIRFSDSMAMTRMMYPGDGEAVFLKNLRSANRFTLSSDGKTLTLLNDETVVRDFTKKE